MPDSRHKRPEPACVEDFDDDKDTVISSSRAFATAGRGLKDGSDSGYSSRAGTVDGDKHDIRNRAQNIDTGHPLMERQRKPYFSGPIPVQQKHVTEQKSSSQPKVSKQADPPKDPKKFCHPDGICYTCDRMGYHMTQEELDAIRHQLSASKPAKEQKPPVLNDRTVRTDERIGTEDKLRRMSSSKGRRPPLQNPPSTARPTYADYNPSPIQPLVYATTPQVMYAPTYSYAYPATPITPSTPMHGIKSADVYYFNLRDTTQDRPAPKHRNSMYEKSRMPIADYDTREHYDVPVIKPPVPRSSNRPDAELMPPPPRKTNSQRDPNDRYRDQQYLGDRYERHDNIQTERHRHEDRQRPHLRDPSPRRNKSPPPAASRPKPQHSVSESYASKRLSRDDIPQAVVSRRAIQPRTDVDQKLAVAEAYQEKERGSNNNADALERKTTKASHKASKSESGSNYSRRESQYSGSKASTKSKSARPSSVIIETPSKSSRPISISMPDYGITVSIGSNATEESKSKTKAPKLIESAATTESTTSKSSATRSRAATSSYTSSERGRDYVPDHITERRFSHVLSNTRPPPSPIKTAKSGRSSSRTPSRSRASTDGDSRR